MKNKIMLVLVSAGFCLTSVQNANAHGVTLAKATELGLHKLERLATSVNPGVPSKIDKSFKTNIASATVEEVGSEPDTQFVVTFYQVVDPNTAQFKLEIRLNEEGAPLSYKETKGVVAQNAPVWLPGTKAVTLSENAFHYLFENVTKFSELKVYLEEMVSFDLKPGTNSAGEAVAFINIRLQEKEREEKPVLRIRIKLDGSPDLVNGVAHEILLR